MAAESPLARLRRKTPESVTVEPNRDGAVFKRRRPPAKQHRLEVEIVQRHAIHEEFNQNSPLAATVLEGGGERQRERMGEERARARARERERERERDRQTAHIDTQRQTPTRTGGACNVLFVTCCDVLMPSWLMGLPARLHRDVAAPSIPYLAAQLRLTV